MKRLLRLIFAALALASCLRAAELVGTIELKSGRTLHNAKVLSDQWDSIVVFATEGLIKVKKSDLPDALLAKYPMKAQPPPPMVMMKNLTSAPQEESGPVPPPSKKKDEPAKPESNGLYKGLMILNPHIKPMQAAQGCVEVTIHNTGSETVTVTPDMIVCQNPSGGQYVGKRFFNMTDLGMMVKKTDTVAPSADVTEVVFFQNEDLQMQDVHWAH